MCSIDDIQYWEDVTHFFAIDDKGTAVYEVDRTDGEFRTYICRNDNQTFDTWKEVKQHLKENV